jgi:hypothetical protein
LLRSDDERLYALALRFVRDAADAGFSHGRMLVEDRFHLSRDRAASGGQRPQR